jgi:predicted nucleic acid-binding protein
MMIGGDDSIFLDTNVLIYAGVQESPFHQWTVHTIFRFEQEGKKLWISRQIIREYLAYLTRPQIIGNPVPVSMLLPQVRKFLIRFQVAEEGPGGSEKLFSILESIKIGGKQIHDANIIATMMTNGISRLFTFNMDDFKRFSGLITLIPLHPIPDQESETTP